MEKTGESKYALRFARRGEELILKFGTLGIHPGVASISPGARKIEASIVEDISAVAIMAHKIDGIELRAKNSEA
jgi:hypothetical protein